MLFSPLGGESIHIKATGSRYGRNGINQWRFGNHKRIWYQQPCTTVQAYHGELSLRKLIAPSAYIILIDCFVLFCFLKSDWSESFALCFTCAVQVVQHDSNGEQGYVRDWPSKCDRQRRTWNKKLGSQIFHLRRPWPQIFRQNRSFHQPGSRDCDAGTAGGGSVRKALWGFWVCD